MAELRSVFADGVELAFSTFEEAVKIGEYYLPQKTGFEDEEPDPLNCTIRCIFEKAYEKDLTKLAFVKLIQPNDIIGLIPAVDMTVEVSTKGYIVFNSDTYFVEATDIDPMEVLYTLLLRKN